MGKYINYIRDNTGKGRCDLTLLYADPRVLQEIGHDLTEPFADKGITKVLALESQGLALGALAAMALNAGLVAVRKEGKIPWETISVEVVDYQKKPKTLEIAVGALSENDRVLIVDDWSETGAQLRGAIHLAEQCGATVVGAAAFHIDDRVLEDKRLSGYLLHHTEAYNSDL